MKATDLRINDIVLYHHEPCYVKAITSTLAEIEFKDGSGIMVSLDELEPCDIYIKTLKQNGFSTLEPNFLGIEVTLAITTREKIYQQLVITDTPYGNYAIFLRSKSLAINTEVFITFVENLHELQHILAIFGKEITL